LILSVLAVVCTGCPHDLVVEYYARQEPAAKDLIGTYRLKSQSLTATPIQDLKSPAGPAPGPCTITLQADGVLEYRHLPIWAGNWANGVDQWSIKEFQSGTGQWKIGVAGSTHDASGVVDLYGLDVTDANLADRIMILEAKPPYELLLGYDDPDGNDSMFFELVPESSHESQ
jgi:hypothetical protein